MPKRKSPSEPSPLTNPMNTDRNLMPKPTVMDEPLNLMSIDDNLMVEPTAMVDPKETSISETKNNSLSHDHPHDSLSLSHIHARIQALKKSKLNLCALAQDLGIARHALMRTLSQMEYNGKPLIYNELIKLTIEDAKNIWGKTYDKPIRKSFNTKNTINSYTFDVVHDRIKNSTSVYTASSQLNMDQDKFKDALQEANLSFLELKILKKKHMEWVMGLDYYQYLQRDAHFNLSEITLIYLLHIIHEKKDLKYFIPKNAEKVINEYLKNFSYSLNKTIDLDLRHCDTLTLDLMRDRSFKLNYVFKKPTKEKEPELLFNPSYPSTFYVRNSKAFLNIHPFNPNPVPENSLSTNPLNPNSVQESQSPASTISEYSPNASFSIPPFNSNPVPENRLYYAEASPIQNIDLTNDLSASVSEPINTSNINLEHNNSTIIHSSLNQQISPATKNDDPSNSNEKNIINELNEIVKEVIPISNDEKVTVISKEMLDYLKQINSLEENAQKQNKSTSLQKIPVLTTDPIEIKKLMDASIAVEKEIDLDKNKNLLIVNSNPTRPPVHNIGFFNSNIHPSCTSAPQTINKINSSRLASTSLKCKI